jgi:hypothetical protein
MGWLLTQPLLSEANRVTGKVPPHGSKIMLHLKPSVANSSALV